MIKISLTYWNRSARTWQYLHIYWLEKSWSSRGRVDLSFLSFWWTSIYVAVLIAFCFIAHSKQFSGKRYGVPTAVLTTLKYGPLFITLKYLSSSSFYCLLFRPTGWKLWSSHSLADAARQCRPKLLDSKRRPCKVIWPPPRVSTWSTVLCWHI